MKKNILFLLPAGFADNDRHEYCPECAEIWGVLNYYSFIKEALDIRYQPIDKPRSEMCDLIGDDNQNCPTLVVLEEEELPSDISIIDRNGVQILDNAKDIGKYFSFKYGTAYPRGA